MFVYGEPSRASIHSHLQIFVISTFLIMSMLCAASPGAAQTPPIDPVEATRVFAERAEMCRADAGHLWGIDLCGPMAFADPQTRTVVSSRPSDAMNTVRVGSVYTGTLPSGIAIANTVAMIGGERWSLVIWPLPTDPIARRTELIHESWHRVEDRLGVPITNPSNSQLATVDGRYLLQLEWRALARALASSGTARRDAITDALDFREARFAEFPNARSNEQSILLFEGLAEDTGIKLSTEVADRTIRAIEELAIAREKPSFVRSFAYGSGPAYGTLLDQSRPSWRKQINGRSDLASMLAAANNVKPTASAAGGRAAAYGGATILASEQELAKGQVLRLASLRASYLDGPLLRIPLRGASVSFNPGNAVILGDAGTYYEGVAADGWFGKLDAPRGALISNDFTSITVPGSSAGSATMYSLTLAPSCSIVAGSLGESIVCNQK